MLPLTFQRTRETRGGGGGERETGTRTEGDRKTDKERHGERNRRVREPVRWGRPVPSEEEPCGLKLAE